MWSHLVMIPKETDTRAAILAGATAGVAYAMAMDLDIRLLGRRTDDFLLLGRPFSEDPRRARLIGAGVHLANAAVFGVVYAAFARDRLPGHPALRGAIFGNVENTLLYPIATLERFHPAVREGRLDRYWTVSAYLQSVWRHTAYGAVLGSLYDRLQRSR
jgi:hypothetical protein